MPHRTQHGPAADGHDENYENHEDHEQHDQQDDEGQHTLTSDDYLTGERITPTRLAPDMTVADLLDSSFQAYNAGRINEAARLYAQRMLDPERDVTVCLTIAGAMTPASCRSGSFSLKLPRCSAKLRA